MTPELESGLAYAQELLCAIDLKKDDAVIQGNEAPFTLVILDQAIIHFNHEAGEWQTQIFKRSLPLLQLLRMFKVGNPEDALPKNSVIPCTNIFEAIDRAIRTVVNLRLDQRVAYLGNIPRFQSDTHVVQNIPEKARLVDLSTKTSDTALALPGLTIDPKDIPEVMRNRLALEDWSKAYPIFNLKNKYSISGKSMECNIVGDHRIPGSHYYTKSFRLARDYDYHRDTQTLKRFTKGIAIPHGDYTDVWYVEFGEHPQTTRFESLNPKELEENFARTIEGHHKTDIDVRVITEHNYITQRRRKQPLATLDKIQELSCDNFQLTLPLAPGVKEELKTGSALAIEIAISSTAINPYTRVLIARLDENRIARANISAFLTTLRTSPKPKEEKLHLRVKTGKDQYSDVFLSPLLKPHPKRPENIQVTIKTDDPILKSIFPLLQIEYILNERKPPP